MQSAVRQCIRRLMSASAGAGPSSSLQASAVASLGSRQLHVGAAGAGVGARAGTWGSVAEELRGMRFDGAQLYRGFASDVHSVIVDGNNVDRAFKKLKRKMIDSGLLKEMKSRVFFQKPSQLRVRLYTISALVRMRCIIFRRRFDGGWLRSFPPRTHALQVIERKEHDARLAKKRLNFKLRWIMKKKNRGF